MRRSEIAVAMTTVKGNMAPELMGGTGAARAKYITPPKAPFLTQRPGSNDPWGYSQNGACTLALKCRHRSQVLLALGFLSKGNTRQAPQIFRIITQPSYRPKQQE